MGKKLQNSSNPILDRLSLHPWDNNAFQIWFTLFKAILRKFKVKLIN